MKTMLDGFYRVSGQRTSEGKIGCDISIDPSHPIFHGHFPGMPVVPGVCLVRIIQEVVSALIQKDMVLKKASSIKFLQPVLPGSDKPLSLDTSYAVTGTSVVVTAEFRLGDTVSSKFKGEFALKD